MPISDGFSFTSAVASKVGALCVGASHDSAFERGEEKSAPLIMHLGTWHRIDEFPIVDWPIIAVSIAYLPMSQAIFVGINGQLIFAGGGSVHFETISNNSENLVRGPLRGITVIDNVPYVVGMGRQVFKRIAEDNWLALDSELKPDSEDHELYGFDSIAGFSENEIYTAGVYGEIWKFDGEHWHSIDTPTNMILSKICCADDGMVYIVGQKGTLVYGRHSEWNVIQLEAIETSDIWGVDWFNDSLYLSTYDGVFVVKDINTGQLEKLELPGKTFCHLTSAGGILWSVGHKDVSKFDGKGWIHVEGAEA